MMRTISLVFAQAFFFLSFTSVANEYYEAIPPSFFREHLSNMRVDAVLMDKNIRPAGWMLFITSKVNQSLLTNVEESLIEFDFSGGLGGKPVLLKKVHLPGAGTFIHGRSYVAQIRQNNGAYITPHSMVLTIYLEGSLCARGMGDHLGHFLDAINKGIKMHNDNGSYRKKDWTDMKASVQKFLVEKKDDYHTPDVLDDSPYREFFSTSHDHL